MKRLIDPAGYVSHVEDKDAAALLEAGHKEPHTQVKALLKDPSGHLCHIDSLLIDKKLAGGWKLAEKAAPPSPAPIILDAE